MAMAIKKKKLSEKLGFGHGSQNRSKNVWNRNGVMKLSIIWRTRY